MSVLPLPSEVFPFSSILDRDSRCSFLSGGVSRDHLSFKIDHRSNMCFIILESQSTLKGDSPNVDYPAKYP